MVKSTYKTKTSNQTHGYDADTDTSSSSDQELEYVISLRPQKLDEIIGRENEKKLLRNMIDSAKFRNSSVEHVLFYGPPGLGKTSLASIIAKERGTNIIITSGNVIEKAGDLAAILTSLKKHDVLFIDEIHRLRPTIEEILYPAMEDRAVDLLVGKGPSARTLRLDLEQFTLVGATTLLAKISAPLRDRFGVIVRLDYYDPSELATIIEQKAKLLNVLIDKDAVSLISERSRMTPRIALRLLKTARDFALGDQSGKIDVKIVNSMLKVLKIYDFGLDHTDLEILKLVGITFDNKPTGLKTISASLDEDTASIETVHEPFLLRLGFLKRTPSGRLLTDEGLKYILNKSII